MKRRLLAIASTAVLLTSFAQAAAPAPPFEAKDQDGNTISSADLYTAGTTLFFFYPKAGTGG